MYIDIQNLTPEQHDRWDWAVAEYNKIQASSIQRFIARSSPERLARLCDELTCDLLNLPQSIKDSGYLSQHQAGNPRSALFTRLVEGKPALIYAPPLSFSQPWYSIIEDNGPWDISEHTAKNVSGLIALAKAVQCSDADREPIDYEAILIRQCPWKVIKRVSETEVWLTYGQWESSRFVWKLSLDSVLASESETFIPSWHDRHLKRIVNMKQLRQEKEWSLRRRYECIDLLLNENKVAEWRQKNARSGVNDSMADRMLESRLHDGRLILEQRRKSGLPDVPTDDDIAAEVDSMISESLANTMTVDEHGLLSISTWRLHRQYPPSLARFTIYDPRTSTEVV